MYRPISYPLGQYDSGDMDDAEWRPWWNKLRECLEVRLLEFLKEANVLEKKGIGLHNHNQITTHFVVSFL